MHTLTQVPAPIKQLFDALPLSQYGPVPATDDATLNDHAVRSYPFRGGPTDNQPTFRLGVYAVVEHESGAFLAPDPWCLLAQLAVCKRNGLLLPTSTSAPSKGSCVLLLSRYAAADRQLPLLVETSSRAQRGAGAVHDAVAARITDPHAALLATLLNSTVYDAYMATLLFELPDSELLRLYGVSAEPPLRVFAARTLRLALASRNSFQVRNARLASHAGAFPTPATAPARPLLDVLQARGSRTLLQLQQLLHDGQFFPAPDSDCGPGYLDLAVASYVFAISLLRSSALHQYLAKHCQPLCRHAARVISCYT
ncbi:ADR303Wp [Eremothecium gossypii ATCC 10895]|uniref:ADR303Wp n=1 Tax=Eremothecium gossypii (strain ATCC 10895 / CBS 109.51 / FGSC 9923 / NRRL Y-1056) TaxID=284811 RepID=Q759H5_EREGS|nr:ADR303Wp [Eremothecium gossypii ATCC 10895]AAS52223.2 ADR303Wp [Eremothecium gossypii ATCC 10895]AEY96522.1 FADR303Wp [Eremothecium gossypii FDAG1]